MKKTWLITGASRGFGRIWAEAALERGDQVTATARTRRHCRFHETFRRRCSSPRP
jgi:NAD(P)-dependent dehydrogenase (short-subunit alcohol dehydrogenase family)